MSEVGHDWYLVQSKVKHEQTACLNLERQGFEVYCPMAMVSRRTRSGYVDQLQPMFSRYVFIRLIDLNQGWYTVKNTRGVSRLVTFGGQPGCLADAIVQAIRDKEISMQGKPAEFPIAVGDHVKVFQGVFSGYEGVVQSMDGSERISLLLKCAEAYTHLSLSRNDVALVEAHAK